MGEGGGVGLCGKWAVLLCVYLGYLTLLCHRMTQFWVFALPTYPTPSAHKHDTQTHKTVDTVKDEVADTHSPHTRSCFAGHIHMLLWERWGRGLVWMWTDVMRATRFRRCARTIVECGELMRTLGRRNSHAETIKPFFCTSLLHSGQRGRGEGRRDEIFS